MKKLLQQFVAWAVILVCGGAVLVAVAIPRLGGATPYTVLTGSMRPGLPPGTLVVVRPTPAEEIRVGDVITFQLESGKPAVATHRVISESVTMTGEKRWQTQGDANDIPDAEPVREEQIRGVLWYSVPLLGWANTLLSRDQHEVAVKIAAGALLAYAAVMFLGAVRDRWTRPDDEQSDGGNDVGGEDVGGEADPVVGLDGVGDEHGSGVLVLDVLPQGER